MWIIKDSAGNVLVSVPDAATPKRKNFKILRVETTYAEHLGVRIRYRLSYFKGDGIRIEVQKDGTKVWLPNGPEYPAFTGQDAGKVVRLFRRSVRSFDKRVRFKRFYE